MSEHSAGDAAAMPVGYHCVMDSGESSPDEKTALMHCAPKPLAKQKGKRDYHFDDGEPTPTEWTFPEHQDAVEGSDKKFWRKLEG